MINSRIFFFLKPQNLSLYPGFKCLIQTFARNQEGEVLILKSNFVIIWIDLIWVSPPKKPPILKNLAIKKKKKLKWLSEKYNLLQGTKRRLGRNQLILFPSGSKFKASKKRSFPQLLWTEYML
uniref:Uncharacterized protein n=1 Tax=Micrurus paraensis TaxID=1970185 RepID=A0A2D4KX83_9SAUR